MKNKMTMDKIFKFSKKFIDKKQNKIVSTLDNPFIAKGCLYASDGVCFIRYIVDDSIPCGVYDTKGHIIKQIQDIHATIACNIDRYINAIMVESNKQTQTEPVFYRNDSMTHETGNLLQYPWFNLDMPNQGGLYEESIIKRINRGKMITHDYYYMPNNPLIVGNIKSKTGIFGIMHVKPAVN